MIDEDFHSKATQLLEGGGLLLLPVDTVPGLACRADLPGALQRLKALKGRPRDKALALAFGSVDQLFAWMPQLEARRDLLSTLLPGPWTLVIPTSPRLAALHPDWHESVGVRVPGACPCSTFIAGLPWPLALSSANLSGHATALQVDQVAQEIVDQVDARWPGASPLGQESTVVDLRGSRPSLLRAGAGDPAQLPGLVEALR